MKTTVRLLLPVPPSPNARPRHPQASHRAKNQYRRTCWMEAIQQHRPDRQPPPLVVVFATYYTIQRWDADNLVGGLKWVLDGLKQKQHGDIAWRQGVADLCGYFVDDDPGHLRLGRVGQERVEHRTDERLEVQIVAVAEEAAA